MRPTRAALTAAVATLSLLAGCGLRSPANDQLRSIRNSDTPIGAVVKATAAGFEPASVTVNAGQAVQFVNADAIERRVASDDATSPSAFDTGLQRPGEEVIVRFDAPGQVRYRDVVTKAVGTVTVTQTAR